MNIRLLVIVVVGLMLLASVLGAAGFFVYMLIRKSKGVQETSKP